MPEVGPEQRADEPVRLDAQGRLQRYEKAFAALDAPFAFIDLDAMWANAAQLLSSRVTSRSGWRRSPCGAGLYSAKSSIRTFGSTG
ncbi:hypothetical protein NIIDMKKI_35930 [Mycobacterium kansasii]|uniref:Uncharacterized protein n=1 Tax=Mycobacterium kansasii TaxID=1768 RepID=A0A7G1IBZ1_MYCKA|nr:hypothetical protein NIIDMKKI_35930 [Mycobacterium kansasii]